MRGPPGCCGTADNGHRNEEILSTFQAARTLGITCSRRLIQELTADTPGNDGVGPLETEFVQVGSGGRRRVRLLAPGGNGDGGRNLEMRFIGSKPQQVLLLRCSEQRGPGTASGPLYIGSLWVFPAVSCIFHPH